MASRNMDTNQISGQTETSTEKREESTVVLTLKKPETSKKVGWAQDTVDNEHLGRKKSKCCCVYKKPHKFGESSSESEEDECDHCSGHVERKSSKKCVIAISYNLYYPPLRPTFCTKYHVVPSHNYIEYT